MAKVHCSSFECKHNVDNRCTAEFIRLSDGHIHTRYHGYKHIHECKSYEKSEYYKELEQEIQDFFTKKEGAE